MDYILTVNYQLEVIKNHQSLVIDEPFTKYINKLLSQKLVDLKTREKLTRKVFGFKNKVPLIINEDVLLICIQSYRLNLAFYINYYALLDWHKIDSNVILNFKDGYCLKLPSYHIFMKQIEKVNIILNSKIIF